MNATLQCFRAVPELTQSLLGYSGEGGMDAESQIILRMRNLFARLQEVDSDGGSSTNVLVMFLETFRKAYPQFAEFVEGRYAQQDAEECWLQLMRALATKLPGKSSRDCKFIQQYFEGEMTTVSKCVEVPEEEPTVSRVTFNLAKCIINNEVNHLGQGIKQALQTSIDKFSPSLQRNAVYEQHSRLSRLPAYLGIEFQRFFWKTKEQKKVKIVRNVKFHVNLDMYEYCTEELQEKLKPQRNRFKEASDALAASSQKGKKVQEGESSDAMDTDDKRQALLPQPFDFKDDVGSNNSGYYELAAVLTHQGMYADAGHYIAWVRQPQGHWVKFDDDTVSSCKEEDVLKLSGGGEWHSAYILLYAPKILQLPE